MKTVGTISRDFHQEKKVWVITAEPHVVMRLKRFFGKMDANGHGEHFLSDTVENARDLECFLSRYPLEASDDNLSYLTSRAVEHKERESFIDNLLNRRIDVPAFELKIPPREYQTIGAVLALSSRGLLNADELGLGKTCSAICAFTDPRTLPTCVVTHVHLLRQWQEELQKFAPHLTTHIIKKTTPYDLTARKGKRNGQLALPSAFPDVTIINWHKLGGWASVLAGCGLRSIVFDEAQELRRGELGQRNEKVSAKTKAAKYIASKVDFRTGLTGTPIYNYGDEFFSVIDVLNPGALGSYDEFRREWCSETYGNKVKINDPKAFGSYLREQGLMIRRTRAEVGRELPPLTTIPHYIDADTAALESVSKSCAELARLILREGEDFKGQKLKISGEFDNRLRQATGIAKAPFVAQFVRMLIESGEKILLGGWHRTVYDIWLDLLKDLNPVMFTGSESASQKEESKRAFVSGESPLMVMSLRAGQGIDGLQTVCRTVVYGELDWSPGIHKQFTGRIFRDGQLDPVMAYFLLADYGSDPVIADALGVKEGQIEPVLDPNQALIEKLTVDPNHIKRLAAAYLKQPPLPEPKEEDSRIVANRALIERSRSNVNVTLQDHGRRCDECNKETNDGMLYCEECNGLIRARSAADVADITQSRSAHVTLQESDIPF